MFLGTENIYTYIYIYIYLYKRRTHIYTYTRTYICNRKHFRSSLMGSQPVTHLSLRIETAVS